MPAPGRVERHERLRLFAALLLPDGAVSALAEWQEEALAGADGARVVPPANLHFTLAFLGSRPSSDVDAVAAVLAQAAARARPPVLAPDRYRETRSVGMLVLDDGEGQHATALAGDVGEELERLGVYTRERRPWLPHVTVLRFKRRPGLAPAPPDIGPLRPSRVALFQSVLRPGGAQYEILQSAPLGG